MRQSARWSGRLLVALFVSCLVTSGIAETMPADYCSLSRDLQSAAIGHVTSLVSLYEAPPASAAEVTAAEQRLGAAYDAQRDTLYRSHEMTEKEYLAYMGAHARAVEEYLTANPSVRDEIDALKHQLLGLVERYEQLKQAYTDAHQGQPGT